LEERYRRALRMLPACYRQVWEDDMVATFMARAYAWDRDDAEGVELGSPSRSEVASIAALALRLRLGGVGAAPRYFAWGEAVRRVALVGLLANAMGALVATGMLVWITQRLPNLDVPDDASLVGFDNRWQALWNLTGLLWVPAFLAVVHGHRRAALTLALLAFTPAVVSTVIELAGSDGPPVVAPAAQLFFNALLLAALTAFHRGAPPVKPRPWLVALPAGAAVMFTVVLFSQPLTNHQPLVDWPGLWCAGVTVGALAYLAATAVGHRPTTPHWPLALTLLAVATFALRTLTLASYLNFAAPTPEQSTLVAVDVAQAAAVLAVGVVVATVSARAMRRLPPSQSTNHEPEKSW